MLEEAGTLALAETASCELVRVFESVPERCNKWWVARDLSLREREDVFTSWCAERM